MDDARLNCCIAISAVSGKVYMYRDEKSITLVESARNRNTEWANWSEFNDLVAAKDMVTLATNLGIRLNFKKGPKEDLSLEVWSELCEIADDRRQAPATISKRDPVNGNTIKQRGRKPQNLGARKYEFTGLKTEDKKSILNDCPCTTRQAKKIYEFFVDEYLKTGSTIITEARMQDIVNDRAAELQTKQDPWRIFQYYRPELMQCQLIRLLK